MASFPFLFFQPNILTTYPDLVLQAIRKCGCELRQVQVQPRPTTKPFLYSKTLYVHAHIIVCSCVHIYHERRRNNPF